MNIRSGLPGDLGDQPLDVVGGDPGGRLEDRAEGGLVGGEPGLLADAERAVGGAGEGREDVVGDVQARSSRASWFS